jgi:DNA-binding transcriptional LysR family regulator
VMLKSRVDVATDLATGRLKHILPDWHSAYAPIYALLPSRRHIPTKTSTFLEAISSRLADL